MDRKRVAIACQGGGSQCAFVAGALKVLLAQGYERQFELVGLSGTSGGALTAALAWLALLKQGRGQPVEVGDALTAFWEDLSAQTPQEVMLDNLLIQLVRMSQSGFLPTFAMSPASPQFQAWAKTASRLIARPEFTDLAALLAKHADFSTLPALVQPNSPVLLVGAANILRGDIKIFSSKLNEIKAESLLASAAIPNLFPAVWVDGQPYWDGIFASNPPTASFLRRNLMGEHVLPSEIWIVQVNPAQHEGVPETAADILDRRNHLAGNLSLRHELELIQILNLLIENQGLTDAIRARIGLQASGTINVRFIRMSSELQVGLDYPSKLSRQPEHIRRLIADGESQARAFLAQLDA
jgi:NTE family protein